MAISLPVELDGGGFSRSRSSCWPSPRSRSSLAATWPTALRATTRLFLSRIIQYRLLAVLDFTPLNVRPGRMSREKHLSSFDTDNDFRDNHPVAHNSGASTHGIEETENERAKSRSLPSALRRVFGVFQLLAARRCVLLQSMQVRRSVRAEEGQRGAAHGSAEAQQRGERSEVKCEALALS